MYSEQHNLFSMLWRFFFAIRVLLFFGFCVAVCLIISGFIAREHQILEAGAVVKLQGKTFQVAELAKKHQPRLLIAEGQDTPAFLGWLWEVYESDSQYIITYYASWQDEIHPNFLANQLYRLYRFLFYGFTVRDYEFVQVEINKADGMLAGALFETPAPALHKEMLWNRPQQPHYRLRIKPAQRGGWQMTTHDPDDHFTASEQFGNLTADGRLPLQVATWNHLYQLPEAWPDASLTELTAPDSSPLTAKQYQWDKFARRSHGDHYTAESGANRYIILFVSLLVTGYFSVITYSYARGNMSVRSSAEQNANGR